jgi:DNA-binding transcriptional MerR regulator
MPSIPNADPVLSSLTLDDLVSLVDLPKRTVRYYIQLGLVDRPEGETRAARYGPKQVEQLLAIRKWTAAGVSLERIRELLSGDVPPVPARPRAAGTVEVWSHLVVDDGVEITIEPGRAGLTPEQVREFSAGVMALYRRIRDDHESGSGS